MSAETLRRAFKHGASARLNNYNTHCSYDDPAHAAEWLKGWNYCDANQQARHAQIGELVGTLVKRNRDKVRREGRDAFLAGRVISGCLYPRNSEVSEYWCEGYRHAEAEYNKSIAEFNKAIRGPTFGPPIGMQNRRVLDIKCPIKFDNVMHYATGGFTSGGFVGKPQAALYMQQIGRILRDPTKPDHKEPAMKSTLAYIFASMLPEVIGVKVAFAGPFDKSYIYKALKSQNIEVDQFVVVDSPNSGLTVVKVKEVVAFDDLDPSAYQGHKWIVGPVSTGDYSAITAKEQAFQAKVVELQRKAQREQAVAALAEQVGGLDALKAIMNSLSAPTEAAAPPAPAMDQPAPGSE